MTSKTNASRQTVQKLNHMQKDGPNWVLIAGSALLSTLTIKLGCKLKQALETRRNNDASQEYRRSISKKSSGGSKLHSSLYHFNQDEVCNHCLSAEQAYFSASSAEINTNPLFADSPRLELVILITDGNRTLCLIHMKCLSSTNSMNFHVTSGGRLDVVKQPNSLVANDSDVSLPLVEIPAVNPNKDSGIMWISSPDRLEMPRKPLHQSNSSDSPCASESGSDVYSKREVIQKLRQQLKRRDQMIMEMQAQIAELQNSLNLQFSQSAHLQAQLDCASRDLFTSEREIQQLRKVIADHCVAEVVAPEKSTEARSYHPEVINGIANGYPDSIDGMEVNCVEVEKLKAERERIEMLKMEVSELKELLEGKNFLLQNYKEQKAELCSKIKELQLKLASQVPNIL